jgi:hypothetical protein
MDVEASPLLPVEAPKAWARAPSTYWLTRALLYRGTGFVYVFAFLVHLFQGKALYGRLGLDPVSTSPRHSPFFSTFGVSDVLFDVAGSMGLLAGLAMVGGVFCWALPLLCWALYVSILNLGSEYVASYGWEWEIAEVGFLVVFLAPTVPSLGAIKQHLPPNFLAICLIRWFCFRFFLGTGLSKLGTNASACWSDYSCTSTHYYTQPMPNPFSWYMHNLPMFVHHLEGRVVIFAEIAAPFLMLVPVRCFRLLAAAVCIGMQVAIGLTGNYALVHPVSIVPLFALIDDGIWAYVLPRAWVDAARQADAAWSRDEVSGHYFGTDLVPLFLRAPAMSVYSKVDFVVNHCLCVWLVYFILSQSKPAIDEMRGPSPWLVPSASLNGSPYYFVNAYGLFGFINKRRFEVAFEAQWTAGGDWAPYDFRCIPGSLYFRGCITAPFHYRLDWQNWIETTASWEHILERFPSAQLDIPDTLNTVLAKVLAGDTQAGYLIGNAFQNNQKPLAIRGQIYEYFFTSPSESGLFGPTWKRVSLGSDPMDVPTWTDAVSARSPNADWGIMLTTLFLGSLMPHDLEITAACTAAILFVATVLNPAAAWPTLVTGLGISVATVLTFQKPMGSKRALDPRVISILASAAFGAFALGNALVGHFEIAGAALALAGLCCGQPVDVRTAARAILCASGVIAAYRAAHFVPPA